MFNFKDWYLKWKLLAINIVITILLSVLTIFAINIIMISASDSILESNLKNVVNLAVGQLETIRRINTGDLQEAGSADRILREIKSGFSKLQISGDGHLSVIDSKSGMWLVHPTATGQNWSEKYAHVKEMTEKGEGFIEFDMPGSDTEHSAYYTRYKPFNWILVSTVTTDSAVGVMSSFGYKTVFIFMFVMLLYALLTHQITERLVIRPLRQINESFRKGSLGDLDVLLEKENNDEIGEMIDNFNKFINNLKSIIFSIRNTAESILNSSSEISSGNNQLSSATQQMASSLQETAASIEEISSSIHETSESSVILADNISKTAIRADKGKAHLKQMEHAILQVKESSAKISEIVDMVNSIAFHTNLLALNAAVEAARAGEQGKGFAVVASEIRSLAQRSGDAAGEIKQLVDSNEEMTGNAGDITKATSQILMDVVINIQNNAQEMKDIEGRSKEQSKGIKQINSAIIQMDEVTQRNAALVEELASSAMDMASISKNLNDEVLKFKFSEEDVFTTKIDQKPSSSTPDFFQHSDDVKGNNRDNYNNFTNFEKDNFTDSSFMDDDQFEEF